MLLTCYGLAMPACRSGVPDTHWDDMLREANGHFLQSAAWHRVQEALGAPVLHACAEKDWMWTGHAGRSMGIRYLYVPCGPTVLQARSFGDCLDDITTCARRHRISFVRLEPAGAVALTALWDRKAHEVKPVQPRHTWLLDLTVDGVWLRRGLTKGHRNSINSAPRKGISIRRTTDPAEVGVLIDLLRMTAEKRGFHLAGERYYRTVAEILMPLDAACLYVAEAGGRPVAAALGFDFNGVRHYAHAGADPTRARQLSAAAPLVWQMILDAKAEGMHTFDFWGVLPSPKPGHPWTGFTQFKQSFGGRMIERAGTWELTVKPWRHRIHRIGRFVHR